MSRPLAAVRLHLRRLLVAALLLSLLLPAPVAAQTDVTPVTPEPGAPAPAAPLLFDAPAPAVSAAPAFAAPAAEVTLPGRTPSLPLALSLVAERDVLTMGEAVTLTLRIEAMAGEDSSAASPAVDVTLLLPPGLVTASGEGSNLSWSGVTAAAGAPFVQMLPVWPAPGSLAAGAGAVLPLTATATATGYAPATADLLLGVSADGPAPVASVEAAGAVVASTDGEVVLLSPPGVLPPGASLQMTELFDALAAAEVDPPAPAGTPAAEVTATLTTTAPLANAAQEMPAAGMPTAETPAPGAPLSQEALLAMTRQDANVALLRMWQLDAAAAGEEPAFAGEVLLRVSVASWLQLGVEPNLLRLWTRENPGEGWTPVPAVLRREEGVLEAHLPHFSQFGLGAGLDTGGDSLPSVKAFTVDELNGGASLHLPVAAPAGLGGLTPNLSFNYSSIGVDDLFRAGGEHQVKTQASSIGLGWSLGGVSYIARADGAAEDNDEEKEFALVLNGERVGIVYQGGRWRTNPETFARIEWHGAAEDHDSTDSGYPVEDYRGWSVFTPDGLRYEFGDDGLFGGGFDVDSPTMIFLGKSESGTSIHLAKRWYLREVTDPLGNRMHYNYRGEQALEKSTLCVGNWNDDRKWYTRSIDLAQVLWNGNFNSATPAANLDHTLAINLTYTTRADTQIEGADENDCLQPIFGMDNQLTAVTVLVQSEETWQTIRSYSLAQEMLPFNYDEEETGLDDQNRLILRSLSAHGEDGTTLRTYTFGYNSDAAWTDATPWPAAPNTTLLAYVNHGWGGAFEYVYAAHKISCGDGACPDYDNSEAGNRRHAVVWTAAHDGQGNTQVTNYFYGELTPPDNAEWGAVANDGGFLGFREVQKTAFVLNPTNTGDPAQIVRWERLLSVGNSTGADASRENPDPRRGKLERREVWSSLPPPTSGITLPVGSPGGSGRLLSTSDYDWRAWWLEGSVYGTTPRTLSWEERNNEIVFPATVIQQRAVTETLYTPDLSQSGAVSTSVSSSMVYTYETEYGNLLETSEWADGNLERRTVAEYFPNLLTAPVSGGSEVALYIANRLARQRVYDEGGACVREERRVYDRYATPGNDYRLPPAVGLLSERAQALSSCSDNPLVATDDAAWQVERFAYDAYGNLTVQHQLAATDGSLDRWTATEYDDVYHLFPVRRSADAGPQLTLEETASYYGVNALSSGETPTLDVPGAFWGSQAEWCDVNGVCARQAYDAHGRRTLRWERVAAGTEWASAGWASGTETAATVRWDYRDPQNNVGWNNVTVTEWYAPRCEGNFVRRHYNGFGQLTQEQRPDDGWRFAIDGCGSTASPLPEVDVDYAYDALGRQAAVSVPHATTANWVNRAAGWSEGYTATQYDALDRVTQTTAPNGEVTATGYAGRQTKVTAVGRNGDPNKVLGWTEADGLGNLLNVRSGDSGGNELARVTLDYDALGNLRQVTPPLGQTTVITYDLGGRKVQMDDPDLGLWRYDYNRQGQLVGQTDACGNVTSMSYDLVGRLSSQGLALGTLCAGSSYTLPYTTVNYSYDAEQGAGNASRGQLTGVDYGGVGYTRTLRYNSKGQLASEAVALSGAPQVYTSTYGYDAYDRPQWTTYPDGEVVGITGYSSRGLATGLASLLNGQSMTLVDCVRYDAAGRLVRLRYGGGGSCTGGESSSGIYVGHFYHPWTGSDGDSNGRPWGMTAGSAPEGSDLAAAGYNYDSFGNVARRRVADELALAQDSFFSYDGQNRITAGEGQSFGWTPGGDFTSFDGAVYGYAGVEEPLHAVDTVNGADRYDYDRNGSMTARNKDSAQPQLLKWDAANRLAQVTWGSPAQSELYGYDENGRRIAKVAVDGGGLALFTFYPFAHYEQTGVNPEGVTKYYFFNGARVAQRRGAGAGSRLHFLFQDNLGSTIGTQEWDGMSYSASQGYYPFGAELRTRNALTTDYRFTGEEQDGTGLYYYGARFYDPQLGQFLSPDTIVPDPTNLMDYQRYAYARGNPLKYNDPSGHQPAVPGWSPDPNFSEWYAYGGKYSGCFKCHASRLNGDNALTNEQLDAVADQMVEGPTQVLEVTVRLYEPADYLLTAIDCADGCTPDVIAWTIVPLASGSIPRAVDAFVPASTIRWTQDNISPMTGNGTYLDDLATSIDQGWRGAPLNVVELDGIYYSLDNRRLTAAKILRDTDVPIHIVDLNDPKWADEFYDKSTGLRKGTEGRFIDIRGTDMRIDMEGNLIPR